jgi:hypothetical protein
MITLGTKEPLEKHASPLQTAHCVGLSAAYSSKWTEEINLTKSKMFTNNGTLVLLEKIIDWEFELYIPEVRGN